MGSLCVFGFENVAELGKVEEVAHIRLYMSPSSSSNDTTHDGVTRTRMTGDDTAERDGSGSVSFLSDRESLTFAPTS